MKIQGKLVLASLSASCFIALMGLLSAYLTQDLNLRFNEVSNETAPALIALGHLSAAASKAGMEAVSIAALKGIEDDDDEEGEEGEIEAAAEEEEEELEEAYEDAKEWLMRYRKTSNIIQKKEVHQSLEKALGRFHQDIMELIQLEDDAEIFEKKEELEDTEEALEEAVEHAITLEVEKLNQTRSDIVEYSRTMLHFTLGASLLMALLTCVLGWWFAKRVKSQLAQLQDAASQVAKGDFGVQVTLYSQDEIGSLAQQFNQMSQALKEISVDRNKYQELVHEMERVEAQLIQSAKMASLGEMATNIAHEINQPLAGISMKTSGLLEDLKDDELTLETEDIAQVVTAIYDLVQRAKQITQHLRVFGRESKEEKHSYSINQVVENTLLLMKEDLTLHDIIVQETLVEEEAQILCNHIQLEQVLTNLLSNSRDVLKEEEVKHIAIRTYCEEDQVILETEDTGPGIPKTIRDRIFEPFFTTKEQGVGTGVGLSISYNIIKNHGGVLEVESSEGEGAIFRVKLPRC